MNPATEWPVPTDDQLAEAAYLTGIAEAITVEQRRAFFTMVRLVHGRDHFAYEHKRAEDGWSRTVAKIESVMLDIGTAVIIRPEADPEAEQEVPA